MLKLFIFLKIIAIISGKLFPTFFPNKDASEEVFLPNEWSSVRECPIRYFDFGRNGIIAPVGGTEAYDREFAHMAAIGWTDENGKISWNCGGSLISENFILTAGHCAFWRGKGPDVVRMGDLNLENDTDNKWAQQLKIEKIIPHPLYSGRSQYNDIALIKLKESITVHDTVCPACLWRNETIRFQFLEACGFGQIGFIAEKTPKLLKVTLSPVNLEECKKSYPPNRRLKNGLTDHQMCAADREHIMDTCLGDSGGPLQIKLLGNGKMHPFIVGVTSFGNSCATKTPGVYTRISSFMDWIESEVENIETDPRKCAFKYRNYREYEPDVSVNEIFDATKFHVDTIPDHTEYVVQLGECSGNLVTEKFVLTSASCLKNQGKVQKITTADKLDVKIKDIIVHPKFIDGRIDNDIALVELDTEIKFNDDIRPACLYTNHFFPQKEELGLLGWILKQNHEAFYYEEFNENQSQSYAMARSSYINYTYCNNFYSPEGLKIDEESKLCYGNPEYYLVPDTCRITHGGPIEREIDALGGHMSFIFGVLIKGNDCGFGFPAIATRVSFYVDWIDSVIFKGKKKQKDRKCNLPSTCKKARDCPEVDKKLLDHDCGVDDEKNPLVCCPAPIGSYQFIIENCPTLHRQYRKEAGYLESPGEETLIEESLQEEFLEEESPEEEILEEETQEEVKNNDEYPHLALIGYGKTQKWHCRGNLISDKHVLTSMECVDKQSNYDSVALGNVNNILYHISKIITNEKTLTLITLDRIVSFSKSIVPICLWSDPSKIPFISSFIISKINSPLIPAKIRTYQTSDCIKMKISGSIKSDNESCFKFAAYEDPVCTTTGTGIQYVRNETGLFVPYLIGQLVDVKKVLCDVEDKDTEYAFTKIADIRDWILANLE